MYIYIYIYIIIYKYDWSTRGTSYAASTLTKKLEHFVPRRVAREVFLWYKCV